ncbi:MAG TPA: twin-arginine translocation signal domain-containing protein [Symbiobacteriaceae bacterium]|nr:twin-arginine translocation signal domain-containing protein [Symbiobacteriaceae bacterium]
MLSRRSVLTACAALAVLVAAGCATPQRQPAPTPVPGPTVQSPTPGIQAGTVAYPTPRAGSAYDDPSSGISTVAAAIPGAGPVKAVALGNVVLIGTTSTDPAVHGRIAQQIRSSFPHVADVRFTSDPAHLTRIGHALSLLQSHQSIAPMIPELWGIADGLASNR